MLSGVGPGVCCPEGLSGKGAGMRFTKMEGLGNDYIYLNCLKEVPEDLPGLAVRLSDRHFGVGADGLICIRPGREGDFTMEMYNADGSRGAMCGNGIRCVGKYVYDNGLTRKTCLTIDTDAGPRFLRLHVLGGQVREVTVDMGEPKLSPPLEVQGETVYPVDMGNPHGVIFCPEPEEIDLEVRGRLWGGTRPFPGNGTWSLQPWRPGTGCGCGCGSGGAAPPWPAGRELARCWRRRSSPDRVTGGPQWRCPGAS